MDTTQVQSFIELMIGTQSPALFFATLFYAFVGAGIVAGIVVFNGIPSEGGKLSNLDKAKLFGFKNKLRTVLTIAIMIVVIVFAPDITGRPLEPFTGLLVGSSSGGLIEGFMKLGKKFNLFKVTTVTPKT